MNEKIKCHICNHVTKALDGSLLNCPACGADLVNTTDEIIQKSARCSFKKSRLLQHGTAILTNKRFFWLKDDPAITGGVVGGIIGSAVAAALSESGNRLGFSIPLTEIAAIEDSRMNLRRAITIRNKNGQDYRILIFRRNNWKKLLSSYL